jgi:asparagine synthase (glutamine-hydrolysing)
MCGFVFAYNREYKAETLNRFIDLASGTIIHRGPDHYGKLVEDCIGFGFRRLSIIDVSSLGNQPFISDDGNIVLMLNGEIYNYVEIKKTLVAKGYEFRSQSDTEVLLNLYRDEGVRCLDQLRGMFAFVIWDKIKKRIFIARDRFGEKPLFFSFAKGQLYLASEIKALKVFPEIDVSLNPTATDAYLDLAYTPDKFTFYNGIQRVRPAEFFEFTITPDQTIQLHQQSYYWTNTFAKPERTPGINEAKEVATGLLKEAIRMQLRSDVPLGAFLSGGIDSSTIVAMIKESGIGKLKTFTIGFENAAFDEAPYAKRVAEYLGTEHHSIVLGRDTKIDIEYFLNLADEPFADNSIIPTYFVSKLAREQVTVSLSGDAGDELFAGYDQYTIINRRKSLLGLPYAIRKPISAIGSSLLTEKQRGGGFIRFLGSKEFSSFHPVNLRNSFVYLTDEFKKWVLTSSDRAYLFNAFKYTPDVTSLQKMDQKYYLSDDILRKVDTSSMAVSLETRVPFLDFRFVEYINSLPESYKINAATTKILLKQMSREKLPDEVFTRKKKGFGIPLEDWLGSKFRAFATELLESSRIIKPGTCNNILSAMQNNKSKAGKDTLWKLINLAYFTKQQGI